MNGFDILVGLVAGTLFLCLVGRIQRSVLAASERLDQK